MLQHCSPLGSFSRNRFTAPVLMPPPNMPQFKVPKKARNSTGPGKKKPLSKGKAGDMLGGAIGKAAKLLKVKSIKEL
eukprot:1192822-Prorocentrum_minimum.AAC.2